MSSGKVLLGVLAGVSAAAALGVLFAPEKGSDTRKKISKKGEHFADNLNDRLTEFFNLISEKLEKAKKEIAGYAELKKSKSGHTEKEVNPATD
jgi:gas vesicle protein